MTIKSKGKNEAEETMALQLRAVGIPVEREYRFHPDRRWRFDFAFPDQKLALEIEGGVYTHGNATGLKFDHASGQVVAKKKKSRHLTVKGFEGDCEKYAEAAILGWRVIRVSTGMVKKGVALQWIQRAV